VITSSKTFDLLRALFVSKQRTLSLSSMVDCFPSFLRLVPNAYVKMSFNDKNGGSCLVVPKFPFVLRVTSIVEYPSFGDDDLIARTGISIKILCAADQQDLQNLCEELKFTQKQTEEFHNILKTEGTSPFSGCIFVPLLFRLSLFPLPRVFHSHTFCFSQPGRKPGSTSIVTERGSGGFGSAYARRFAGV
jgi:hypothetical protein